MSKITYEFSYQQDDSPVRGNAMVSGDDVADKALEAEIIERLNRGDETAWAVVTVSARFKSSNGTVYTGQTALGACSANDVQGLKDLAKDYQLEADALEALKENMKDTVCNGDNARLALEELETEHV